MSYYFLIASLPDLRLGEKPEISFEEAVYRASLNLSKKDRKKLQLLRSYIDLINIRYLLLEESIDPKGNFSEKELDEALILKEGLPEEIFDFLSRFDSVAAKIKNFAGVMAVFFRLMRKEDNLFLQKYFDFERKWRLILMALRAKKMQRDIQKELFFEDLQDPLVMHILVQKDMEDYTPPPRFESLKKLWTSSSADPLEQEFVLAKWRIQEIEDLQEKSLFSLDAFLAYLTKLWIVEDWFALDKAKGEMILEAFVS